MPLTVAFGGTLLARALRAATMAPVADGDVISHGGLTTEDHARAEVGAAGDAGLTDDDAVGTDLHVVGDLDEVVDLGAVPLFLVEPNLARSMQVQEPISTSSSMTTVPIWGTFACCLPSLR